MRIGLDGTCLSNRRGFGRFARQLFDALAADPGPHEYVLIIDRPSVGTVTWPDRFEVRIAETREAPSRAASSSGRRSLNDLWVFGRTCAQANLDLMYFPASYSFAPVWNVPRVVVTIHDAIPWIHPELIFPDRRGRLLWMLKERLAIWRADHVMTVSGSSRADLITHLGIASERLTVMPEGSGSAFRPTESHHGDAETLRAWGIDPWQPYFLYVGGLSPHKNLLRLVRAFAATGLDADGVQLVLVGDHGDVFHTHVPEIRSTAEHAGVASSLILPGYVPDEPLALLYRNALALVQPSMREGFGLPALEALACGTPVLCSDRGSLPEVVGQAGLTFDPLDETTLARTLRRYWQDAPLRDQLRRRTAAQASRFTWAEAARILRSTLERVGHRHPMTGHVDTVPPSPHRVPNPTLTPTSMTTPTTRSRPEESP